MSRTFNKWFFDKETALQDLSDAEVIQRYEDELADRGDKELDDQGDNDDEQITS